MVESLADAFRDTVLKIEKEGWTTEKGREEGVQRGMQRGIQKGREEGGRMDAERHAMQKGMQETAFKMKQEGYSLESIERITGLSNRTNRKTLGATF